eukprot:2744967-Rhodomonas_salina.5
MPPARAHVALALTAAAAREAPTPPPDLSRRPTPRSLPDLAHQKQNAQPTGATRIPSELSPFPPPPPAPQYGTPHTFPTHAYPPLRFRASTKDPRPLYHTTRGPPGFDPPPDSTTPDVTPGHCTARACSDREHHLANQPVCPLSLSRSRAR